ncbi:VQ motif-containing protein 4 [Cannabis sativa]|uniref:VQ domain-containing protein n=1 Tax=Cannabis sativa TaxID=3483 RepID=A0A803QDP4_CANSA|nr:VQ motif-containing protein 4 [Cannabis sativa]
MEISPRHQLNPSPSYPALPSPNSHSTTSTTSSCNSNGVQASPSAANTAAPPLAPKPITRSESTNPYPTTFVQADTSSFKQVVQMLTGSTETAKQASSSSAKPASDPSSRTHIPPVKSIPKKQQQSGFKLYERRNSLKNLKINPLIPIYGSNNSGFSPRKPEILSPSILDFPSLVLSPVTPLIPDPFDRSGSASFSCSSNGKANFDAQAEERAIKEKGFYLHPSPTTTPRDPEPRLLPLFPTTSPRAPGSSLSS